MVRSDRLGFSRRDLVVILVAAGLLLALLLTALPQATESARRRTCTQRVGKLVEALSDFNDAHGTFPVGSPIVLAGRHTVADILETIGERPGQQRILGPNWACQLTPQLGEVGTHQLTVKCIAASYVMAASDATGEFRARTTGRNGENGRGLSSICDRCSGPPYCVGAFWSTPIGNPPRRKYPPAQLICPSAHEQRKMHASKHVTYLENLAKSNYAACVGADAYAESVDNTKWENTGWASVESSEDPVARRLGKSLGIVTPKLQPDRNTRNDDARNPGIWLFGFGRGTKARHITDGLEHTIIVSELLTVDGEGDTPDVSEDLRGCWTSGSMGASLYSHRTTPNSREPDVINGCEADESAYRYLDRRLLCRQQPATGITAGDTYAAARSAHPGGVVAGRADGSVDFFSDDIDPAISRAMATRAGND